MIQRSRPCKAGRQRQGKRREEKKREEKKRKKLEAVARQAIVVVISPLSKQGRKEEEEEEKRLYLMLGGRESKGRQGKGEKAGNGRRLCVCGRTLQSRMCLCVSGPSYVN